MSFFERWAKRKAEVAEGKVVPDEPPSPQPSPLRDESRGEGLREAPPPTLEDAQSLTPDADFTRFVANDVPADVKNTALKKLFSDPHFNQMDGLDVYIDDYSKPDPLPAAMLRQLAGAKFLNLFPEPEEGREAANNPTPESMAQSPEAEQAVPPPEDHADPDLRLQQDDAPGPAGPGQGAR